MGRVIIMIETASKKHPRTIKKNIRMAITAQGGQPRLLTYSTTALGIRICVMKLPKVKAPTMMAIIMEEVFMVVTKVLAISERLIFRRTRIIRKA
jgi:hypothetical protein